MDGREQAIQYFTQKKRELTEKKAKLMRPVVEVDKELVTVTDALAMMLRDDITVASEMEGFPLRKIKNMTQTQALIEIAKYNGGTLKSLEAKPILIAAKVMKNTKNAARMVNAVITRSDVFVRIGRGIYQLKDAMTRPSGDDSALADMSDYAKRAGLRTTEKPVQ